MVAIQLPHTDEVFLAVTVVATLVSAAQWMYVAYTDRRARKQHGAIYLPVGESEVEDGSSTDSQTVVKAHSGRSWTVDLVLFLLTLVKLVFETIRIVKTTEENDGLDLTIASMIALAVGWFVLLNVTFGVLRHIRSPPASYTLIFGFYMYALAAEYFLFNRHFSNAHHTVITWARVGLGLTAGGLFMEAYQRFRMDSWGVEAFVGTGRMPWRETNASLVSRAMFFWLNDFIRLGAHRSLNETDLWELQDTDRAAYMIEKYQVIKQHYPDRALIWNLLSGIKWLLSYQFLCAFLYAVLALGGPFFLNLLIGWVADPNRDTTHGWMLLVAMTTAGLVRAIFAAQLFYTGRRASLGVRAVLVEEVYNKALRRAATAAPAGSGEAKEAKDADASGGKILLMMSVDAERLQSYVCYAHRLTIETPLSFILSMAALFYTIGWSALAGVFIMVISGPLGGLLGKWIGVIQDELMTTTDKRVDVSNEVLQGIRIIKYFGWEPQFIERVFKARRAELVNLRRLAYSYVGFHASTATTSLATSFITFVVFTTVAGKQLTPQVAFTAISLLAQVASQMSMLPFLIMEITQVKVSYDRIAKFLREWELEKYAREDASHPYSESDTDTITEAPQIGFRNAAFSYFVAEDAPLEKKEEEKEPTAETVLTIEAETPAADERIENFMLRNLDIDFPIGGLSVVAGPTGAGKSSLILALLGEMKRVSGSFHLPDPRKAVVDPATRLHSGIAYVAQTPWLIHATIRDNILFGCTYEPARYQKVVEVCALLRDFETLPGGDLTEIGEKGVNVSGGQKARISLARAAYSYAGTILMDDTLSAVDPPTAHHLLKECLTGWLSNRTRILVSHAVGLVVPAADYVVYMKDGQVAAQGAPAVVVQNEAADDLFGLNLENAIDEKEKVEEGDVDVEAKAKSADAAAKLGEGTRIIDEEERATGSVKAAVYWAYIKAAGGVPFLIMFITSMILVNTATLGVDWWLKKWTDATPADASMSSLGFASVGTSGLTALWNSGRGLGMYLTPLAASAASSGTFSTMDSASPGVPNTPMPMPPSPEHSVRYYIAVYAALGVIGIIFSVGQASYLVGRALTASNALHNALFTRIMGAPLRFFEITPLGRIINRLSKDVKFLDQECVWAFEAFVAQVFRGIYILGLITYVSPPFLAGIVPIAYLYISIARVYLKTSRELKRLESTTRSPLYSQFSETLTGVTTIRAYGAEERLLTQQRDKVDANHRAYFLLWAANRWLCLRTDVIGVMITLATGIAVVAGDIGPGWAGLAISYSLNLAESLLWTVRMHAEMEMSMNSVERVLEYTKVDQEPPAIIENNRPPAHWPTVAKVEVRDLVIKYSHEGPAVLKNLNFTIQGGHKVGVVGRTGAGKSTLSLAFFRILPFEQGSVHVDGVDIESLGVRDVRSRFTIIPQDPVLFTGTLRSNLDPFDEHSDETLWEALGRVHVLDSLTRSFKDVIIQDDKSEGSGDSTTSTITASHIPATIVDPIADISVPNKAVLALQVSENGSNFSQGQRQLLCLARAFLRRTKLVFLDEATASVDQATDARIQQTMRECFADATVLTIAHRLSTICDYDRVLVLDQGQVAEYDTPAALIAKEGGIFSSMCAESGELDELKAIIRGAEEQRQRKLLD
ncbi:hypothetical protein HKX48_001858 [Thoreauomyces humboldtii]|nr:hypothetical protein HKX48_001858 [Thoreauomyces humboldtii]